MLNNAFADRPTVHPDDDPATPDRRVSLARSMLVGAIRRYEDASERWTFARECYPNLMPSRAPLGTEESAERAAWRVILEQTDDDFDRAEEGLAVQIERLYSMLAPPGLRPVERMGEYFVPRAVHHAGQLYVLAYSVNDYEPRTNIIAVYRDTMAIELDEVTADAIA
jgi:hypothetical protein